MKEYFKLQYTMTNRKLSDIGINPTVGYLLSLLSFVGLSMFLFYKTDFATEIYIAILLFLTSKLSEIKRNEFLKICFGNKQYKKIRVLENLTFALPFIIFLICKQQFYPIILLITMTILIALFNFQIARIIAKMTYNFTIPTPFYKKPFEFTVGFRNTFFMFFIAYGLTIIAIKADNFNLGIFSLVLIFFTILTYYQKIENEYFVWSHSFTPAKFLIEKIKIAFLFSFYLCIPVLFLLSIFYFEHIKMLYLFYLLGNLYLATFILAKYSTYPNEINLVRAIIMIICLLFPPMLIAIIPLFAKQSINKLKEFLK